MKPLIRLRGVNGNNEGIVWESSSRLRAGRTDDLEIVLDETSVSRLHAEIRATDQGWQLRDLGSTNGTFLNGVRVGKNERRLHRMDILQFAKVTVVVIFIGLSITRGWNQNMRPMDRSL